MVVHPFRDLKTVYPNLYRSALDDAKSEVIIILSEDFTDDFTFSHLR
jgi:hypothetical protein